MNKNPVELLQNMMLKNIHGVVAKQ